MRQNTRICCKDKEREREREREISRARGLESKGAHLAHRCLTLETYGRACVTRKCSRVN